MAKETFCLLTYRPMEYTVVRLKREEGETKNWMKKMAFFISFHDSEQEAYKAAIRLTQVDIKVLKNKIKNFHKEIHKKKVS